MQEVVGSTPIGSTFTQTLHTRYFIGIGGPSRAGKSTLALLLQKIAESLHLSCETIALDNFTKSSHDMPMIKTEIDWENPESIDWPAVKKKVNEVLQNKNVVVLEGLFTFSNPELSCHFTHTIWLDIHEEVFKRRKIKDKRWGDIPSWYIDHIWSSGLRLTRPSEKIVYVGLIESLDPKVIRAIFTV